MISVLQRYEDKSNQLYKDIVLPTDAAASGASLLEADLLSNLQLSILKLQNPYVNIFYWVKGEINDVVALQQCIAARLGPNASAINKLKSKIASCLGDFDKIQAGKKSLKTMFKSTKETENYAQKM